MSRWIFSSISYGDPEVKAMLEFKFDNSRNQAKHPLQRRLSSSPSSSDSSGLVHRIDNLPLSTMAQADEIRHTDARSRADFFSLISRYGNPAMLRPLLEAKLHQNEWLPAVCQNCTFIRECMLFHVRNEANLSNLFTLMEYDTDNRPCHESLLDMFLRVTNTSKPLLPKTADILNRLLQNPRYRSRTSLPRAIVWKKGYGIIERLMQAGCGTPHLIPRDGFVYPNSYYPETIEVVLSKDLGALELLLQYKYCLEVTPSIDGFTALYRAMDRGWVEGVELLLQGGADIDLIQFNPELDCGTSLSAWDLVRLNLNSDHPRQLRYTVREEDSWGFIHVEVSEDIDTRIYQMIREQMKERGLIYDDDMKDSAIVPEKDAPLTGSYNLFILK